MKLYATLLPVVALLEWLQNLWGVFLYYVNNIQNMLKI